MYQLFCILSTYPLYISYKMIKNYYEILGVPRDATQQIIAENYRKLALRYNPKTTKQPLSVATQVFSELGEAYEVLSDTVKRAYLDKFGVEKLKLGFYQDGNLFAGYRYANNPDEIFQKFFQNQDTLGNIVDFKINKEGSLFGYAFGGLENKSLFVSQPLVVTVPCKLQELYKGGSKLFVYDRKVLNSDGRTTSLIKQHKTIHIKPGYHEGTLIHFPSQGHQSVHRTTSDLFFKITQLPNHQYQKKGDDLIYTHEISLANALDCRVVKLVTLDGRHLSIAIDSIITPKILHQVANQGFINEKTGKRGSLYIKFNIKFPVNLSEDVKNQLRTLLS